MNNCDCGQQKQNQSRMCHKCWVTSDECLTNLFECYRAWAASVDDIAVERLLAGEPPTRTTRAERQEAVRYLTAHQLSISKIAARLRISRRTVERLRARSAT